MALFTHPVSKYQAWAYTWHIVSTQKKGCSLGLFVRLMQEEKAVVTQPLPLTSTKESLKRLRNVITGKTRHTQKQAFMQRLLLSSH